jgi:hypothetical protein
MLVGGVDRNPHSTLCTLLTDLQHTVHHATVCLLVLPCLVCPSVKVGSAVGVDVARIKAVAAEMDPTNILMADANTGCACRT